MENLKAVDIHLRRSAHVVDIERAVSAWEAFERCSIAFPSQRLHRSSFLTGGGTHVSLRMIPGLPLLAGNGELGKYGDCIGDPNAERKIVSMMPRNAKVSLEAFIDMPSIFATERAEETELH
eukprot:IDg13730t1